MMALPKTFVIKSAYGTIEIPTVGFGTWAFGTDTSWCYKATLEALKAGYRHVDCAWSYGTDTHVGRAIRDSGIPRRDLFITTKFWPHWGSPQNVSKCLDACLANMGLDYVDLYLIHWPVVLKAQPDTSNFKAGPGASDEERGYAKDENGNAIVDWEHSCASIAAANGKRGSIAPTWMALQKLVEAGKTRAIGVSNFNQVQLEEVLSVGGNVPLSCNQVEAHPLFQNNELLVFMGKHGILKAVYCPFAGKEAGDLLGDPKVKELAKKNDMGAGQLLQSWAVQRGTVPLGKSQTPSRIKENLAVRAIPEEDARVLDRMDKGEAGRTVNLGFIWGVSFYV